MPMPSVPAARIWRRHHARLKARFEGASLRVCLAFWLFGLINNIFYVIILTAALDLVGPSIPKATVLLACIIPGLATKIVTPYAIHLVPYSVRILLFALLSTSGMLAVALSPNTTDARSITSKMAGIVLANVSSSAGEVNFLSLTHFYGPFSLAAWGSGTGGAGLVGAGAYTFATTTLGFSVHATLICSTLLSFVLLLSYFVLLPRGPLQLKTSTARKLSHGDRDHDYERVNDNDDHHNDVGEEQDMAADAERESTGLLSQPAVGTRSRPVSPAYERQQRHRPPKRNALTHLRHDIYAKLARTQSLVMPYMLPLFLVYLAEYTINQGVAPTLLFPLAQSPFQRFRAFYPTYATIYQLGVFLSRSSLPFLRIRSLYVPTLLQLLNLGVLIAHALAPFIPSVWYVFAIILWEGLLGGLVYVSTFAAIREEVPPDEREFSLGAATVSDSAGIFGAGLLGAGLETALCNWQVEHLGRNWCKML